MAYPQIACHPPLGEMTILPPGSEQTTIYLHIQWHRSRPDFPWEIKLCAAEANTEEHPSQWTQTPMKLSSSPSSLLQYDELKNDYHAAYEAALSIAGFSSSTRSAHIAFTIMFRVDPYAPWQLLEPNYGIANGVILVQAAKDISTNNSALTLSSGWNSKQVPSSKSGTSTFDICSEDVLAPQKNSLQDLQIRTLGHIQGLLRFFALVRLEPYWIGPRQGSDFFYISEDGILCSFLTDQGVYITLLAFNGIDDTYSVLRSGATGEILVAARNDGGSDSHFRLLAAVSSCFEDSVTAVMDYSRQLLMESEHIKNLRHQYKDVGQDTNREQELEEWFDSLAFCTWNALGPELSKDKLLDTLNTLSQNGIHVSTLLIDDNWQTLGQTTMDYSNPFYRGWADMEANKEGFPGGLQQTLIEIRQRHPNIKDVGVWHALFGYWGGIASQGSIAKNYTTRKMPVKLMQNIPATIDVITEAEIGRFFDDFYAFLASCGITFVKTDVQYMLSMLEDSQDRVAVSPAFQSAWTMASLRHFSGKAISCMSQVPQILFHSLLQNATPKILIRNSDDFYPEVPASHPWHIWANAHNAILTQHLNGIPDWDMFQTSHTFSAYHAAARCISGGPVLITDTPGEHDVGLIKQMFALSPSGRSISLRPNFARTVQAFNKYTDGQVLKIGATVGEEKLLSSIVGCFNVSDRDINFILAPSDFPEIHGHQNPGQILIRSYRTSQVFGPFNTGGQVEGKSLIYAKLPIGGFEIFTAYPLLDCTMGESECRLAVLGLTDKMSGAAAVISASLERRTPTLRANVQLKALGVLGLWISRTDLANKERLSMKLEGHDVSFTSRTSDIDGGALLEANLAQAWTELKLQDFALRSVGVTIEIQ